jgi:hypothetical protein
MKQRNGPAVGIFDRHLVPDDVGRHHCVVVDEVQRVAMEIAGAVEPARGAMSPLGGKAMERPPQQKVKPR